MQSNMPAIECIVMPSFIADGQDVLHGHSPRCLYCGDQHAPHQVRVSVDHMDVHIHATLIHQQLCVTTPTCTSYPRHTCDHLFLSGPDRDSRHLRESMPRAETSIVQHGAWRQRWPWQGTQSVAVALRCGLEKCYKRTLGKAWSYLSPMFVASALHCMFSANCMHCQTHGRV